MFVSSPITDPLCKMLMPKWPLFLIVFIFILSCSSSCSSKELLPWPVANVRVIRDLAYGPPAKKGAHLLDLYLPADFPKPLPLIVCVHGGGWSEGDKSMFPAFLLPSMGYAVASINYRLSSDAKFPAQIDDCWSAINWLASKHNEYGLDENRIGLWGGSAGGHLVLLAGLGCRRESAIGSKANIRAVCDWCGPTDLTNIADQYPAMERRNNMERYVTNLIGAEPAKRPDLAKAASPITYVGNKGPAFLVMHGDKDQIVPFAQSKVFCERLKANGIRCSFVVIPGGDHNFYSSKIEQQVGEFFDKTVKSNQGSPQKK